MSSTTDPTTTTPAATPDEATTPSTTADDTTTTATTPDDTTTPAATTTTSAPAAPLSVNLEVMLYEAGIVANGLSPNPASAGLAQKLQEAEATAEAAGETSLTFAFSIFESGLALHGLAKGSDAVTADLVQRLDAAIVALMQANDVDTGNGQGGTLGDTGDGSVGGDDDDSDGGL